MKVSKPIPLQTDLAVRGNNHIRNSRQGSVIIAVIIALVVLTVVAASFMQTALNERSMATRSNLNYLLLNLAESGVESAVWSISNEDWTAWTSKSAGDYYKLHEQGTTSNGYKTQVHVMVQDATGSSFFSNPIIYAEATATLPNGDRVTKQLRVRYGLSGPGLGVIARDTLDLGGTLTVDSYDSRIGPPDFASNRSDKLVVGAVSRDANAMTINGDVSVFGFAGTGQEAPLLLGNSLEVRGEDTPTGVSVDPDYLFQDFHFEFEEVVEPDWSGASTSLPAPVGGVITLGNTNGIPVSYDVDYLELKHENVKVVGPVQLRLDKGLNVKSGQFIEVETLGSLEIYTPGDVNLAGQAIANVSRKPNRMKVFGTNGTPNGQLFDINGQGEMSAVIYAPNAESRVKGTASFLGSMVVNQVTFAGEIDFHFDSSLLEENQTDEISEWYELRKAEHRYDFASFTPPSS